MMSDTVLDRIATMEDAQRRIVAYFGDLKDDLPEAGTMALAVEVLGECWVDVKHELEHIHHKREQDLNALGELETRNEEALETIKNQEDRILVLEGTVKRLSFLLGQETTTMEKLNDRGTFIGRRSSGDLETIIIPDGLDIFNPEGVEWSEEFGEVLAVFPCGFKVGLDFLRKLQELHHEDHEDQRIAASLEAYRKQMEHTFVEVLRTQGVTWADVPSWLELMFGIQTTANAVKMKFHRANKTAEGNHDV